MSFLINIDITRPIASRSLFIEISRPIISIGCPTSRCNGSKISMNGSGPPVLSSSLGVPSGSLSNRPGTSLHHG
eukprot:scaffold1518_cov331-Pavlova_lutheri.AAC.31